MNLELITQTIKDEVEKEASKIEQVATGAILAITGLEDLSPCTCYLQQGLEREANAQQYKAIVLNLLKQFKLDPEEVPIRIPGDRNVLKHILSDQWGHLEPGDCCTATDLIVHSLFVAYYKKK